MSNAELYRDLLKMKRTAMGPGNRKKTANKQTKEVWYFPTSKERAYAKKIGTFMRKFTVPLTKSISKSLEGWILEYHGDAYSAELLQIIEDIQKEINKQFGPNAPSVRAFISGTGSDVSAFNLQQFQKFNKELLGVDFVVTEAWEKEVIEAWGETNFELVKSLSTDYVSKVNTLVSEGVQFGETPVSLMKKIKALNRQITDSRARLIARDQVGKLNAQLTKRRMEDVGIDMYTWLTAGDERVRGNPNGPWKNAVPSHYIMSQGNKVYRWDDSTVYSEDNGKTWKKRKGKMTKAIPGQDIQCRCTAIPFILDLIAEVDKEIKEEQAA